MTLSTKELKLMLEEAFIGHDGNRVTAVHEVNTAYSLRRET